MRGEGAAFEPPRPMDVRERAILPLELYVDQKRWLLSILSYDCGSSGCVTGTGVHPGVVSGDHFTVLKVAHAVDFAGRRNCTPLLHGGTPNKKLSLPKLRVSRTIPTTRRDT